MANPIIVGVDFGMTGSAAAYYRASEGSRQSDYREVELLPLDQISFSTGMKIPSVLFYDKGTGHLCQKPSPGQSIRVADWFKVYLDVDFEAPLLAATPSMPTSRVEALQWCRDYLSELTARILNALQNPSSVCFYFTTPTTWASKPFVLATFRDCIMHGLNREPGTNHTVSIGLSEPVAGLVHHLTLHQKDFNDGDVVLTCDAGGGTTDLATVQIGPDDGMHELYTLDGISVGSCSIDMCLLEFLDTRFSAFGSSMSLKTWLEANARFHLFKRSYTGSDSHGFTPFVSDMSIHATSITVKQWFDGTLDSIFMLIDRQLELLSQEHPNMVISHLLLTGGLSMIPYIRNRIQSHYENAATIFPNAEGIRVIMSQNPTGAPSLGQVYHVLNGPRKSVTNWGVLITNSRMQGKVNARSSIEWLIREAQSLTRHTWHEFSPSLKERRTSVIVVTCSNSRPQRYQEGVVELAYRINLDVQRPWWKPSMRFRIGINAFDPVQPRLRFDVGEQSETKIRLESVECLKDGLAELNVVVLDHDKVA